MTILSRSDGSGEFSWPIGTLGDRCRSICSVNGPLKPQIRDEQPTQPTIELVFRPAKGVAGLKEVYIQDTIYGAITSMIVASKLPRSLVQIVIQSIEDGEPEDSSVYKMACSINAAALALCSTAIPLSGIAVAVVAAIVDKKVLVNPNAAQIKDASSLHVAAFHTSFSDDGSIESKLVLLESQGSFDTEDLAVLYEVAEASSLDVYRQQRKRINESTKLAWK